MKMFLEFSFWGTEFWGWF